MSALRELLAHSQSCWLDNLTRRAIGNGDLRHRVGHDGLRGITSNPEIFYRAIAHGAEHDARIAAIEPGCPTGEIYGALVISDIRDACDILRPVYDQSEGRGGFVSLEVSPHLAHERGPSIAEAQRLAAGVAQNLGYFVTPANRLLRRRYAYGRSCPGGSYSHRKHYRDNGTMAQLLG